MGDWVDHVARVVEVEATIAVHAREARHHLELALAGSESAGAAQKIMLDEHEDTPYTAVSADGEVRYGPAVAVRLGPSIRGGVGVFAAEDISAGTVVERCPLLLFPTTPGEVSDFCVQVRESAYRSALPLGFGAIYNHSPKPNTTWMSTTDTMTITATEPISSGAEILINYGPQWFTSRDRPVITGPDGEDAPA